MQEQSDVLKILDMNVMDMDFSKSVCEILLTNNIETIDDIVSLTEDDLFDILGKSTYLDEVKKKLSVLELSFKNGEKNIGELTVGKSIGELDLSVRQYTILKRAGINTIEDLMSSDISMIRGQMGLNRKAFDEVLLRLDELGANPIEMETKKLEELQKLLQLENNQDRTLSNSIEIENIKVNKGYILDITFSNAPKEYWIKIFKGMSAEHLSYKLDGAEGTNITPEIIAAELINTIKLKEDSVTAHCDSKVLFTYDNYEEVLVYFIKDLNRVLKNTQRMYNRRNKEKSTEAIQLEIDKTIENIDLIKSVYARREKREKINNHLSYLIKKERTKL